jgi:hypothetical protein
MNKRPTMARTRPDLHAGTGNDDVAGRELSSRLFEHLRGLNAVAPEQLSAVQRMQPPPAPTTIAETGVSQVVLTKMLLKMIHVGALRTVPQLIKGLSLTVAVVEQLLQGAVDRKLIEVAGSNVQGLVPIIEYGLSDLGRRSAADAFEQNQYLGPVPVPLAAYAEQIERQRISHQSFDPAGVEAIVADLVIDNALIDRLGPAIAARRSILLYGPPGNGKSSIAERIGRLFTDIIFVPYAIEVDNQIIRVFDARLHGPSETPDDAPSHDLAIRRDDFDERWVPCRRPVAIAGGELTLEMLDVRAAERAGFYDAPLHVKAMGGIFIIDDFGRQLVNPKALLDRWIVPLEKRIDYLKLQTGKSFSLPFDALIVFSTNLEPESLMDTAFLRRIPYKIQLPGPSEAVYRDIFRRAATLRQLELPDALVDRAIAELRRRDIPLACYQPDFIAGQIEVYCRFHGRPVAASEALILTALDNLSTRAPSDRH